MAFALRKTSSLKQHNLTKAIFAGQISGFRHSRLSQLPNPVIQEISDRLEYKNVPLLVSEISECTANPDVDADTCLAKLKNILHNMTSFDSQQSGEDSIQEESQNDFAKLFVDFDGLEVLVELIMTTGLLSYEVYNPKKKLSKDTERRLRVLSMCYEIIARLIASKHGQRVGQFFISQEDLLHYTFTLLSYNKTCVTACQFLEDLLQARNTVLNLQTIPNLRKLISSFDDEKLANFCRLLAVTISDLDIYENKSSLFAQNKQKRSAGFVNIRDSNQEFLLAMPELLPRLIAIVTKIDYSPRYNNMESELDCWMEWIENSMAEAAFDTQSSDDFDNFIGGISTCTSPGGPLTQQSGLKISNELILRVHVVYVLGLLLVGKHRKKVQRKFAELMLVPGLSELFDEFIWKCQTPSRSSINRHRLRGHNDSCECSPEVALKIQFLRLVHSFCDHSDFKHLLLTKMELNEIKKINSHAGPQTIEGLDTINKNLMCRGNRGLLTKIVDIMKNEPTVSTFRFWLARAVESYLRGSTSYCDQVFLLRRGLLQHITANIINTDMRLKEILQSSFDLLGELVKFNYDAFIVFETVLNTEEKFDKFLRIVNKNLVDSNMFIRSLVLSLEHFMNVPPVYEGMTDKRPDILKESRLLRYAAKLDTQMNYMRKLIGLINVENLTQENVSCLNTTLVYFMFAKQRNQLPKYLRALSMESRAMHNCKSSATILKNLRDLLMFWQDHYIHKDKDCSALEKSSRISFDYWKFTVVTMVSDDRNEKNAVIHYMDPYVECYR